MKWFTPEHVAWIAVGLMAYLYFKNQYPAQQAAAQAISFYPGPTPLLAPSATDATLNDLPAGSVTDSQAIMNTTYSGYVMDSLL
jgi:hypothetical protein